jgi:hypothetical protein
MDWPLMIVYSVGLICLTIIICVYLIIKYDHLTAINEQQLADARRRAYHSIHRTKENNHETE